MGYININPTADGSFCLHMDRTGWIYSTRQNISDLKAGQYQLLIVDRNECKASETFNLTEPGKLGMTFTLPSSTAGGFNINCAGDSTGSILILNR